MNEKSSGKSQFLCCCYKFKIRWFSFKTSSITQIRFLDVWTNAYKIFFTFLYNFFYYTRLNKLIKRSTQNFNPTSLHPFDNLNRIFTNEKCRFHPSRSSQLAQENNVRAYGFLIQSRSAGNEWGRIKPARPDLTYESLAEVFFRTRRYRNDAWELIHRLPSGNLHFPKKKK